MTRKEINFGGSIQFYPEISYYFKMVKFDNERPAYQKLILLLLGIICFLSPLLSTWRVEYRGGSLLVFPLLLLIIQLGFTIRKSKKIEINQLLFGLFLAIQLFSLLFSSEKELSVIWTLYYIGWFALFYATQSGFFSRKLMIMIFSLSLFLVLLYCWWQYFIIFPATAEYFKQHPELSGNFTTMVFKPRLYGTFQYPNSLAGFIILSSGIILTPILLKNYSKKSWKLLIHSFKTWWVVILFGGCSFFIWFTASRAGIVIWIVQLAIIILLFLKSHLKITLVLVSVAIICSSGALITTSSRVENSSTEAITNRTIELSAASTAKLLTFQGSLQMIKNNPWVGVGAGLFGHHYYRYRPPCQSDAPKSAHNLILDIAAQTGIFSGLLLVILLLSLLKSCSKHKIVLVVLSAVLVHSMVDWDFNNIGISFCFFIFCGLYSEPKYVSLPRFSYYLIPAIKIGSLFLLILGLIYLIRSAIGGFLYISANQNQQFENYHSARQQYHNAIIINPGRANYYVDYSFTQPDLISAKNSLVKAVELAPFWFEPYYQLARINLLQNNITEARAYSDSALQLFPTSAKIRFLQDSIYLKKN